MSYPIIPNGELSIEEISVIKEAIQNKDPKTFPNLIELINKVEKETKAYPKRDLVIYWAVD